MHDGDEILARFHSVLVAEISEHRPDYLQGPFTVAEIYQTLIPYRMHRDRLGVEMNGDYEHVLLRLLSGEGGFLRIESEVAQKEIAEELESNHPDTSIFREFAAVDVRLEPEAIGEIASAPPSDVQEAAGESADEAAEETADTDGSALEDPGEAELELELADDEDDTEEEEEELVDQAVETEVATPAEDAETVDGSSDVECHWCDEALPERDGMKFCPHCGKGLFSRPCPSCGTVLESNWRFCVTCGAEVGA